MSSLKKSLTTYTIIFITFIYIGLFLNCVHDSNQTETNSFSITIKIQGQGIVKPESGIYDNNTSILFEANPKTGYYFDCWEVSGKRIETETYNHVVKNNLTIRAIFLPIPELSNEVEVYSPKNVDPNPIFMIENGGSKVYLTSKTGERLKTWNFDSKLGNDIELLSDGSLLGIFKPDEVFFSFGGYGGVLKKFNTNGILEWDFKINTQNELAHHDFEVLPNGNILVLVWERFKEDEASILGFDGVGDIFLEKIVEITSEDRSVVWEWRSVDHLIQDFDSEAKNFGIVSEHPEKINLNYSQIENGDLMHANGLFYDEQRDLIYLSVNFFSEVWAIPHQYDTKTTITEKGDLNFRFGNPKAYNGNETRLFFNNHHPNLVTLHPETKNHFLIYMNGSKDELSIVYEFILPPKIDIEPKNWTTPQVFWKYSNSDLFNLKISGALRLPNGNTLICEGDFGYWEVTPEGEVVWKFRGDTTFWRGYVYPNYLYKTY